MSKSNIEWTGFTWNAIVGCSVHSPGCTNCYAMKMARRIELMGTAPHYAGLTRVTKAGAVWTGKLAKAPRETLLAPLRWKKPRRIFVNSMSDLFHEDVPDDWIDQIFAVMALCPQHTFQVLTKRSRRMREYFERLPRDDFALEGLGRWHSAAASLLGDAVTDHEWEAAFARGVPLANCWLGVSTEDQARADERIPDLLATPAAARFVSAEPLLAPIDLTNLCPPDASTHGWSAIWKDNAIGRPWLDWIIVGGESGPRARRMELVWVRSLVAQCRDAGVACFVKQLGSGFNLHDRKGGDPAEWPADLRIREMPT